MSDFYGFSQSEGISQGNALTDQVKSMNDGIRVENENTINNANNKKSEDEELGIFGGAKDAFQTGSATSTITDKVAAYKKAVGKIQEGVQSANDTVAKVKQGIQANAPEPAGEETATSDAADAVTDDAGESTKLAADAGKTALNEGEETLGTKAAGAIGKGAGLLGALGSSALSIRDDVKSFEAGKGLIAGDNMEEKIANIGTIGGAALDMLGLVPGFQLAGVFGTALEGGSGLLDIAGQAQQAVKEGKTDTTPPPLQATVAGSDIQQAATRVV